MSEELDDATMKRLFKELRVYLIQRYPDLDFDTMEGWMTARERTQQEEAEQQAERLAAGWERLKASIEKMEGRPWDEL